MSLKVSLKNLGVLERADFTLGDLTIICGKNNTGKTYATYALYSFLENWRQHIQIRISDSEISTLRKDGAVHIDLTKHVKAVKQTLAEACEGYTDQLDQVFAATEGRFGESEFHVQIDTPSILEQEFEHEVGIGEDQSLFFSKSKGSEELIVTLVVKGEGQSRIGNDYAQIIATRFILSDIVFSDSFPSPFISSAERTGVATFRKELNFARNRLLEEMARAEKNVDPRDLLFKAYQSYPQPIEKNAEFIRKLEDVAKRKSFITREHPEVLEDFAAIIGGDYNISQNDQLHYMPKGTQLRLTMDESSSAVRSLLDIGSYLHHVAAPGQLLIMDEPELNLHPENQRRIARLFARLVNVGVKVFVTTHSDYIIKELNTLIMLNHDKPHLKRIAYENGYRDAELVKSDQVKVYITQVDPSEDGQESYTLVPADIDPVLGIEARSFDETIDDMNRIQEDIIWGKE